MNILKYKLFYKNNDLNSMKKSKIFNSFYEITHN